MSPHEDHRTQPESQVNNEAQEEYCGMNGCPGRPCQLVIFARSHVDSSYNLLICAAKKYNIAACLFSGEFGCPLERCKDIILRQHAVRSVKTNDRTDTILENLLGNFSHRPACLLKEGTISQDSRRTRQSTASFPMHEIDDGLELPVHLERRIHACLPHI